MSKYYLSFGINKYPSAPLNGCVNDSNDVSQFLVGKGYQGLSIQDAGATKMTILNEMRASVGKLKYRDTLVVHYSGHGSWVPDYSGDEPDGRDEVWCAYDYENGGLVTDDEIYDVVSLRAFGTRVIILSDSCFSGSVSRVADLDGMRAVRAAGNYETRVRYMPPANFLSGNELQKAREVEASTVKSPSRRGSVLISGCSDQEYSYDAWINNRYNGAFTYNMIKADQISRVNGGVNIAKWYDKIRIFLPSNDYPQTPQLTASWYQKTFWRL